MTKKQFKEDIKRGLGDVILELYNTADIDRYKETALWACLNNTCYDAQSEGGRGFYLYWVLKEFQDDRFFEDAIIKKYNSGIVNSHVFEQLTELLYYFAEDGGIQAKITLDNMYKELYAYLTAKKFLKREENRCRVYFEELCIWLTSLNGYSAFKKIVIDIKKYFDANPDKDPLDFEWFYINSKNKFGQRVTNFLNKQGIKSESGKKFKTDNPDIKVTFETVIKATEGGKFWQENRATVVRFAKTASNDDLLKLAEIISGESDPITISNLLWAFTIVPFPRDVKYLIEYSQSENEELSETAFCALKKVKSKAAHDYAVGLLQQNKNIAESLNILSNNYENSDGVMLEQFVQKLKVGKDDGWHGAFGSLKDLLLENNKAPAHLLNYIYKNTLCSFCRYYIVRAMEKRKILTDKTLEECRYDCNEDIRDFADKTIKKAKTEKTIVAVRQDGAEYFLLWYTDTYGIVSDGFLTKDYKILSFFSEADCKDYAVRNKLKLSEDVARYDFDNIPSELNCQDKNVDCNFILEVWNITGDFARTLKKGFIGDKKIYDALYDKIFYGCNISAMRKDGEKYIPRFSEEEKYNIRQILENCREIIKSNLM